MNDDLTCFQSWCIGGAMAGLLVLGLGIGGCVASAEFKEKAVNRGFARYHPLTGKWEWRATYSTNGDDKVRLKPQYE